MNFDLQKIAVSDPNNMPGQSAMPKWIRFMLWAGWEMRMNNSDSRQIMVMLLPERYCCSAFCALGAVMAGSTLSPSSITWNDLRSLCEGETIFLLIEHGGKLKPVAGTVGKFDDGSVAEGRWIHVTSGNKALNGASVMVLKDNVEKYGLSHTAHASQIKLGKLKKISGLFSKTVSGYDESWIVSNSIESAVVTNKTEWLRQIEGLNIVLPKEPEGAGKFSFELSSLLMISDCRETPSSHTRVVSSLSIENTGGVPLVILDGADALSKWESCLNGNLIVLLSRSEFTEEAQNILSMLSSYRDDSLLMELGVDPVELMPADSEISLFALPGLQV